MKATELRIGNYLQGQQVVKVNVIFTENFVKIEGNISMFYIDGDNPCLEPIPLTEEWLIKFGINEWFSNNRFQIRRASETHFEVIAWKSGIHIFLCHLEHVNQLQNLHFALTGEELTVK